MSSQVSSGSPEVALLGLPGFAVVAVAELGGELDLVVETTEGRTGCPRCGVVATAKDRRPHLVRDLPIAGRPVVLLWHQRVWICREPGCPQASWTERSAAIRPRAVLTERARRWAFEQVGRYGRTVSELARTLGVGWHTVMRAVREFGEPVVDDPTRVADVRGLGVDETAFLPATATSTTHFVTGIVDLTRGRPTRLLDVRHRLPQLRMTAPCGPTRARLQRPRVSPDQAVTPDRAATSARAPSRPWSRRLRHWTPLGPRPGSRACGRGGIEVPGRSRRTAQTRPSPSRRASWSSSPAMIVDVSTCGRVYVWTDLQAYRREWAGQLCCAKYARMASSTICCTLMACSTAWCLTA